MIYFNGFSLKNEETFFNNYTIDNKYTVIGFSYGAIKAFEYVLDTKSRVDRLILLSPSFFHNTPYSFSNKQLEVFELNKTIYIKKFLKNIIYPSKLKLNNYLNEGTKEELRELLTYVWNKEKLKKLINKDIKIEVFLGEKDKIINSQEALTFFKDAGCTVYFLKELGHLLLGEEN